MKIEGNGDVVLLQLRHKGANTSFEHNSQPFGYPAGARVEPANISTIQFDDIYEVDILIRMLREFKDANYRYFGDWRRV
jgi:hypothetical protein